MMRILLGVVLMVSMGCGGGASEPSAVEGVAGTTGASGPGAAGRGAAGSSGATQDAGTGASGTGSAGSSGQGVELVQQALSGSRLKAYWLTSPDGAKQFALKWYDSLLKVDCYMTAFGADGSRRCIPLPAGVLKVFGDSSCATPIIGLPKPAGTCGAASQPVDSEFYSVFDAASCQQAFQRGASFTGTVYEGKPGACTLVPGTTLAAYAFFMTGTAVDPSMFAAVTYAHD